MTILQHLLENMFDRKRISANPALTLINSKSHPNPNFKSNSDNSNPNHKAQ